MLLGSKYNNNLAYEVFLRTMEDGTFLIKDIRKKYNFISNSKFIEIIRTFSSNNVLIIDKKNKTLTYPKKFKDIVDFIEETDFLNKMIEDYTKDAVLPIGLEYYLKKSNFCERYNSRLNGEKNVVKVDVIDELNRCLYIKYKNNYINEIICLNLQV